MIEQNAFLSSIPIFSDLLQAELALSKPMQVMFSLPPL